MKLYDTVLFDLDGTHTDPAVGIINSVVYALERFNIAVDKTSELTKFIGPPLLESFEKYYGFSESESVKAVEFYREYFREKGIYENIVYNGVVNLLNSLKSTGRVLIVATSKPEVFAKQIVEHFCLGDFFTFVAGGNLDGTRSKKDEVIDYALRSSAIANRSSAIMIGDRKHDIVGAKKVGIDSVGVLYGYGSLNELTDAGATYIADSTDEVFRIVCNRI